MYIEIKTTDKQRVIDEILKNLDSESPVNITVQKTRDLYRVEVSEAGNEPAIS